MMTYARQSLRASLLITMMLLPACGISNLDRALAKEAANSALCSGLKEPIDAAVEVTIRLQKETPAQVINHWTSVVVGYDEGCKD
jgi:hypothetical protein